MSTLLIRKNLRWLSPHDDYGFINRLYSNLYQWTDDILSKFGEVPFGYTEWTLSGHLAIAAARCGMFALQDYIVEHHDPKGKTMRTVNRRPDLYIGIRGGDKPAGCVFEVKSVNVDIDKPTKRRNTLRKALADTLPKDWNKVQQYGRYEALYCCGLVGFPMFGQVESWRDRYGKTPPYIQDCNRVFNDLMKNAEAMHGERSLRTLAPNFIGGYFLSHDRAKEEMRFSRKHGWEPVAVGMLWAGKIGKSPAN